MVEESFKLKITLGLLVFGYFEFLLPYVLGVLNTDFIIISLLYTNASYLVFCGLIYYYCFPYLKKYKPQNFLTKLIIFLKNDLNPKYFVDYNNKKIRKLLIAMIFLYIGTGSIYQFFIWFIKEIKQIVKELTLNYGQKNI